jgi:hypothetical protein
MSNDGELHDWVEKNAISDPEGTGRVIVCQGPPLCDLTGECAERAMPCPLCRIDTFDRLTGLWYVEDPSLPERRH